MWNLIQTVDTSHPVSYNPRKCTEPGSRELIAGALRGMSLSNMSDVQPKSMTNGYHYPNNTQQTIERPRSQGWGATSSYSVQDYSEMTQNSDNKENEDGIFSPEYETLTGNKITMYPTLYRITQSEFKKLSEQVKDLPPNGKFKGQGFKRFYTSNSGEQVPVVYRSQLAASAKVFQTSRERPPYENKWRDELPTRCRPVSCHTPERLTARGPTPPPPVSVRTPQPPTHPRSRSSPRPPSSVASGRQIQLRSRSRSNSPASSNARGISPAPSNGHNIARAGSPTPSNGSLISQNSNSRFGLRSDRTKTPRTMFNESVHRAEIELISDHQHMSVTNTELLIDIPDSSRTQDTFDTLTGKTSYLLSGVTPYSVYGDKHYIEEDDDNDDVLSEHGDKESDQDSAEEGSEPNLDSIDMKNLPELNLRPEQIDAVYTPEYARGDRRKYDFDALNIVQPANQFAHCLSEEMMGENLTVLSRESGNWREYVDDIPEDIVECDIIDRLIELERLQSKTDEWERARKEKLQKQAKAREAKNKVNSTVRHQGAKLRERKCCSDCMQLLCIGNCAETGPSKSNLCKICHEPHSTASCTENVYTGRNRSERVSLEDEKPKPPTPARPKSCISCQRTHNARIINANNLVIGRPKSSNSTYSRGQDSKRRDLRQFSATQIPADVERDLIKLGIDPVTMKVDIKANSKPEPPPPRPHTACETTTRGRAGIYPGKSYFSQLRSSITDLSKREKRAKSAGPRRKSRKKRPQTALV